MALAAALALLSGCAAQRPLDTGTLEYPDWLLTGERLFAEPVRPDEAAALPIIEPSPAMRAYVAERVGDDGTRARRFRRLFAGLKADGHLSDGYTADRTLTAAETFDRHTGNCLSYTSMFIALARAAGLDAVFQVVDVPPTWDADAAFLVRYTHVNALLKDVRLPERGDGPIIVDFNAVVPDADHPRREVSDRYAASLFHANRAIARLREGRPRESFAELRRALDLAPGNADLWINLGALYATHGDVEAAAAAYEVALQLDPHSRAAYSGLARSHATAGHPERAAYYREKARDYRDANPYYHYAMARAAFEAADFERARARIVAAIELEQRKAKFHLFQALVEEKLGDPDAARESLRRARRHGVDRQVKQELLQAFAAAGPS